MSLLQKESYSTNLPFVSWSGTSDFHKSSETCTTWSSLLEYKLKFAVVNNGMIVMGKNEKEDYFFTLVEKNRKIYCWHGFEWPNMLTL